MSTKAVILVGGDTRGTRFRPISLSTPKVLFPAGGKPLLAHAVDSVLTSGINVQEILLIGFYENSIFDNFISDVNQQHPEVSIRYLREYKALGTAGGLYHFRDQILRGKPEQFLLINADVCCSFPLAELASKLEESKGKGVIMGTKVPKGISPMFGGIIADKNGKVLHYVEKPDAAMSDLVNGGVYLFKTSLFEDIKAAKQLHESHSSAHLDEEDETERLSVEQDLIPQLADEGELYVYITTGYWRQVKDASSALIANRLYLDDVMAGNPKVLASGPNIRDPVYIDAKAKVDPSAVIGPNVTIGAGVKIGAGARVRDAVLFSRTEIKPNACVINSILCPQVKVGNWARIEGSEVAINEYESRVIKDGVKVPRTTILAQDVVVADEIHVQNSVVLPHKDIKSDVKNEIVM